MSMNLNTKSLTMESVSAAEQMPVGPVSRTLRGLPTQMSSAKDLSALVDGANPDATPQTTALLQTTDNFRDKVETSVDASENEGSLVQMLNNRNQPKKCDPCCGVIVALFIGLIISFICIMFQDRIPNGMGMTIPERNKAFKQWQETGRGAALCFGGFTVLLLGAFCYKFYQLGEQGGDAQVEGGQRIVARPDEESHGAKSNKKDNFDRQS